MPGHRICGNFDLAAFGFMFGIPSLGLSGIAASLLGLSRRNHTARAGLLILFVPAAILFTAGAAMLLGPQDGSFSLLECATLLPAPIILAGLFRPRR